MKDEELNHQEEHSEHPDEQSESREVTDDVSFEEVNEDLPLQAGGEATIKKLREKIKKLEAEKKEYLDLSQRTRADYANFKKEVEENRILDRKFSTKRFIAELLPVLDAYDMAQGNKEAWEKVDQNWRSGIEYIFNQLHAILDREGVKQFGQVGDLFDPKLHESMQIVEVTNKDEHDKIVRVLQKGYLMHDTVLRPARVHVGRYEEKTD